MPPSVCAGSTLYSRRSLQAPGTTHGLWWSFRLKHCGPPRQGACQDLPQDLVRTGTTHIACLEQQEHVSHGLGVELQEFEDLQPGIQGLLISATMQDVPFVPFRICTIRLSIRGTCTGTFIVHILCTHQLDPSKVEERRL